ncbi:MAG: hypothetical protein ACK5PF_09375 [bacterium]|jgi:hypothetical protein
MSDAPAEGLHNQIIDEFVAEGAMSDKALLAKLRIAEIDEWFAEATGWGSWMVEAANEREGLVNGLRQEGYLIEHKYQARSSTGGRVD